MPFDCHIPPANAVVTRQAASAAVAASGSSRQRAVAVLASKQQANVRHGSVVGKSGQKYGVVVGRFNDLVTKLLLEGAYGAFESHGVPLSDVEVRQVIVPL
jgi:6,7-dimethyl-8-ribityllumazine synthase